MQSFQKLQVKRQRIEESAGQLNIFPISYVAMAEVYGLRESNLHSSTVANKWSNLRVPL